jgi:hypothetical protein
VVGIIDKKITARRPTVVGQSLVKVCLVGSLFGCVDEALVVKVRVISGKDFHYLSSGFVPNCHASALFTSAALGDVWAGLTEGFCKGDVMFADHW